MRTIFFWSFLLITVIPVTGQNWRATPYEFHAGIVLSNYFGDIGGSTDENTWYGIKDLDFTRTRPGFAAGIRYFTLDNLAINWVLSLGWLSGSDAGWKNDARGYIFNSVLVEPSVRAEYYPVKDIQIQGGVNRRGMRKNYATISAYIFGGAGAAIYKIIPNEPLRIRRENEGIDNRMLSLVLPVGLGMKIGINNRTDIGLEFGGRFAFNDHIDGLTTNTSAYNDFYYMTSVQLIYRLPSLSLRSE